MKRYKYYCIILYKIMGLLHYVVLFFKCMYEQLKIMAINNKITTFNNIPQ